MRQRELVICVHNSARSQMAEEYLRKLASDRFEVESSGLEPGPIQRLHWPFDGPSQVTGTREEKLIAVRAIRDQIKDKILGFVREQSAG